MLRHKKKNIANRWFTGSASYVMFWQRWGLQYRLKHRHPSLPLLLKPCDPLLITNESDCYKTIELRRKWRTSYFYTTLDPMKLIKHKQSNWILKRAVPLRC